MGYLGSKKLYLFYATIAKNLLSVSGSLPGDGLMAWPSSKSTQDVSVQSSGLSSVSASNAMHEKERVSSRTRLGFHL